MKAECDESYHEATIAIVDNALKFENVWQAYLASSVPAMQLVCPRMSLCSHISRFFCLYVHMYVHVHVCM